MSSAKITARMSKQTAEGTATRANPVLAPDRARRTTITRARNANSAAGRNDRPATNPAASKPSDPVNRCTRHTSTARTVSKTESIESVLATMSMTRPNVRSVLTVRNSSASLRWDREFGRCSGGRDASDLVGLSFREPQRAVRAGGDVVRTAVGCGNRKFAKGHRQRVPADACDRRQKHDRPKQQTSISILHVFPPLLH